VSLSNVADMPAGYKAAIALQYFTDTDPEGNPVESAEQTLAALREEQDAAEYAQSKPAGGSFLQKFFAAKNEGSVSPFDIMAGMQQPEAASTDQGPEQVAQVQGFADGGFAFRGTSLPGMPNPYLNLDMTPEERKFYQAREAEIKQYVGGLPGYNKQVEEYSKAADQYNKLLDMYMKEADIYNKAAEQYNAMNTTRDFKDVFPNVYDPGEFNVNFNVPVPKEPTPPGYSIEAYNKHMENINAKQQRQQKVAAQQELALDVVQDPGKYNLAGFGFSQGGDASKQGMLERVKRFIVENDLTPADVMLTPRTIPLGLMLQPTEANAGEAEMLERYRRMAEQEQGKVVGRAKGSGPRAEEVPQLDQFGRVILPEPAPEPEYSLLEKLYGGAEAAAAIGSSIPAAFAGAVRGLVTGKNIKDANRIAGETMQGMTFMPRGKAGQGYTESLSQMIPQELQAAMPQSQLMNLRVNPGAARYLGERAREGTEAAIMPVLRSQTENPNLRPEAVYDAMLGDPAETVKAGALAAAPKQKETVDRSLLMPSEDRPFVGELERRIADLPGPVQKQQLMGMLKKDGREYEMIRLEQALEQYGPSDKLTPNQIMSALKDTSPQRYVMEVFEPDPNRQADFISHVDNPYPSKPLGTANLSLALTEDQKKVKDLLTRQQESYADLRVIADRVPTFSIPSASRTEFLTSLDGKLKSITNELESIDSKVARNIQRTYNENIAGAKEFSEFLDKSDRVTVVENDPRFKQIGNDRALSLSVTDNGKRLKEILGPDATKILEEKGITFPLPLGANQLELIESVLIRDNANKLFKDTERSGYMSATLRGASGPEDPIFKLIDDVIARSAEPKTAAEKQELAKEHIAIKQKLREEMRPFELGIRQVLFSIIEPIQIAVGDGIDTIMKTSLAGYTQGHTSIASNNPISFARFVDMDANDAPALNDPRGAMVFTELQSDRRGAIKKGNLFDVEEAFPGMDVVSEDVLRQLIAKSAVAAAAKRGKGVVLFPSSDSMQPQLYTPEIMGRVAKQVAKDLGNGYQAKQFVVPSEKGITRKVPPPKKDADGNFIEQPLIHVLPSKPEDFTVTRWGIVLPEDATQAIPQQGIRFAKGGAVSKLMYDRNP